MKSLIVKKVNNYIYTLECNNKLYNLKMEFILEEDILENDIIYMNYTLLKEIENNFTSFGPIDSLYGYNINDVNDKDLIIIKKDDKYIYLKRLYG